MTSEPSLSAAVSARFLCQTKKKATEHACSAMSNLVCLLIAYILSLSAQQYRSSSKTLREQELPTITRRNFKGITLSSLSAAHIQPSILLEMKQPCSISHFHSLSIVQSHKAGEHSVTRLWRAKS